MLIICLSYIFLTNPAAVYVPHSLQLVVVWTVLCNSFVNRLFDLVLFRYVRNRPKDIFKNVHSCCELPYNVKEQTPSFMIYLNIFIIIKSYFPINYEML